MEKELSSEVAQGLSFVLDWASSCGLDSVVLGKLGLR